jgi:hypothetical protein
MPCILIAETHREWGTKNQIFTVGFFYSLPDVSTDEKIQAGANDTVYE